MDLPSGGSSAVQNLFPQPNVLKTAAGSAYVHKDAVEAYTFHAICSGTADVSDVQRDISANWTTTVTALGLAPLRGGTPADRHLHAR